MRTTKENYVPICDHASDTVSRVENNNEVSTILHREYFIRPETPRDLAKQIKKSHDHDKTRNFKKNCIS